jgi:hypothetical protein
MTPELPARIIAGMKPLPRIHADRVCPAEMKAAQANELRKGAKIYPLRKMFLDVADDDPLLPHSEPAADLRLDAGRPGVKTCNYFCFEPAKLKLHS